MTNFTTHELPGGINLHFYPTEKFKTIVFSVFLHQNLRRELAASTALLPYVLERGTEKWPTTRELVKGMEELYGADILTDIIKRGERHVLQFILEIVNPLFVPGEENLEEKGLEFLKEVLANPVLEEGRFKESYVKREKELLKNRIEGLINDKVSYALERCIQEMCRDENYGVFRLGKVEDLAEITPQNLYEYYRDLLARAPLDVFVLGKISPAEILPLMERVFDFKREDSWEIEPTQIYKEVGEPRYVEEKLDVSQGKLTLGYRTNTSVTDGDFY
ncbi:MAG: insulinase family protein, partial [Candidatus Syntrophonatronum acetioxidans]